jgi:hypothetical protein
MLTFLLSANSEIPAFLYNHCLWRPDTSSQSTQLLFINKHELCMLRFIVNKGVCLQINTYRVDWIQLFDVTFPTTHRVHLRSWKLEYTLNVKRFSWRCVWSCIQRKCICGHDSSPAQIYADACQKLIQLRDKRINVSGRYVEKEFVLVICQLAVILAAVWGLTDP